jgi:hypothetical protein
VGTPSTVCVNNDLSASETSITLWSSNDELSRRLDLKTGQQGLHSRQLGKTYVVDGLLGEILGRNDSLDNLFQDFLSQLLSGNSLGVLSRDNNGVNLDWNNGTVVVLILNCDLGLGVRSEPWEGSITAGSRHSSVELVCQLKGQREQFWGLIGSISKHDTLVTSTELLKRFLIVETLSDIGGLLLNGNENVAGLVVKTLGGVIITNVLDGVSDDLLVIKVCLCGDFAEHHDHAGLCCRLASNLGERVNSQAGIENGIRDLISDLVWVTFSYRFRLK